MRRDVIVGRKGDSLLGEVLDRAFTIRSSFGPVKVKTDEITWIHYANGRDVPEDELWLRTGDRLSGRVEPRVIRFRAGGERMEISCDAIHSIVVGGGFSGRATSLR